MIGKRMENSRTVRVSMPPDVLLCPSQHAFVRDVAQDGTSEGEHALRLGDRVVNAKQAAGAPFGLRGTVVATHPTTGCVEVVFDRDFIGGTSLHGMCSNGRGRLITSSALRNISRNGQGATSDMRNPTAPSTTAREEVKATRGVSQGGAPSAAPKAEKATEPPSSGRGGGEQAADSLAEYWEKLNEVSAKRRGKNAASAHEKPKGSAVASQPRATRQQEPTPKEANK